MKIAVTGTSGRMGQAILAIAAEDKDISDVIAIQRGSDIAASLRGAQALIDFTSPASLHAHLAAAVSTKKPIVIGTTGLSEADFAIIRDASKVIPVLQSANTSIGITVLSMLVRQTAQILKDGFDIEIFEAHHRHKKDAPSGTALMLGQAAADGRGIDFASSLRTDRNGERPDNSIGFSVFRGVM